LRDCIKTTGDTDRGICNTCGKDVSYSAANACHFQSRRYNNTRYDEMNVVLGCVGCNCWGAGEQYKFAKWLDEEHGEGTADMLEEKARVIKQWKTFELEELIEVYKNKVKNIEQT